MRAISSSIRRTQTPDGGILLDIERGQMFSLNEIGSKILDLLETGYDEGQIAEHLSAAYGTDIDTVQVDVHDFLESLNQQHILEQCAPTATSEREATDGGSSPT